MDNNEDGRNEQQMWNIHCRGEFASIDRKLISLDDKASNNGKALEALRAQVKNGLSSRMDRVEARLWAVLISLLVLAGSIITNMIL